MEYREDLKSLKVIPIGKLLLHEETIESLTAHLKLSIKPAPYFTNPIVVDRKSLVILDGTHRAKAFQELGFKNLVCQLVDYSDPGIKVHAWYPVLRCANITDLLDKVANRKTTFEKGMAEIKKMKAAFLLCFDRGKGKECYLVAPTPRPMAAVELFAAQKHALARYAHRHVVHYVPDEMDEQFLRTSGAVILYRKHFTKAEIISIVKGKGLFLPPKSTRHLIPMRVLGLDIPMSWLNLPEAEAQKKLDMVLIKRSEAGVIRFYAEPTLVLNDYRSD